MAQSYLLINGQFSPAGWQRWGKHRKLSFFAEALHDSLAEGSGVQRHNGGPEEVRNPGFVWQARVQYSLSGASASGVAYFLKLKREGALINTERQP